MGTQSHFFGQQLVSFFLLQLIQVLVDAFVVAAASVAVADVDDKEGSCLKSFQEEMFHWMSSLPLLPYSVDVSDEEPETRHEVMVDEKGDGKGDEKGDEKEDERGDGLGDEKEDEMDDA